MATASISNGGDLNYIANCYLVIPGGARDGYIRFKILPDLSDGKEATYNNEPIMARAFPLKTYSHSGDRAISLDLHFISLKAEDYFTNLQYLRLIQSAVYPQKPSGNLPFQPPPVCRLKYGELLGKDPLCVVGKSYSVKYDTTMPMHPETLLPARFTISTTWEAAIRSDKLPGQDKILKDGQ